MFQQRWEGSLNLSSTVRLAAAPTRIYAVDTHNNILRLVEVYPNGIGHRVIGNLFTSAGATCQGLAWDDQAGVLKALIRRGTAQYIYQVSTSDGHAAAPQTMPSGTSLLYGLAIRSSTLYSFDSAGAVIQITSTGTALNVNRLTGKSLSGVTTLVQDIHTGDGDNFLVAFGRSVHNYKLSNNTTTAVTLPTFSAGTINGVTIFGNNLYAANDAAVRFVRANTVTAIGSRIRQSTSANPVPMVRKNDAIVYMLDGLGASQALYRINVDGTRSRVGLLGQSSTSTALVWSSYTSKLYGLVNQGSRGVRVFEINETTGAATAVRDLNGYLLRPNGTYENGTLDWGFAISATRLICIANGRAYHVYLNTSNLSSTTFLQTNNNYAHSAGFYYNGTYYDTDHNAVVSRTSSTTPINTVLSARVAADSSFQINGRWYFLRTTRDETDNTKFNLQLYHVDALFPEFYTRGTPLAQLYVDKPADIRKLKADASVTEILPAAHGGKGPYTYAVRYNNSATLPLGITYNSASRGLTVDPATANVGEYILEYKVTDSETPARSVSQSFLVRIGPAQGVNIGTLTVPSPEDVTITQGDSRVIVMPRATQANGNIGYDVDSIDTGYEEDQLPPGFTYDEATNSLQVSSSAEVGVHRFRYEVEDGFTTSSDAFTVTIQAPIGLANIPDVTVYDDQNYSATLPASTGGSGARSYALNTLVPAQKGAAVPGEFTITPAAAAGTTLQGGSYVGWGQDATSGDTFFGTNTAGSHIPTDILGIVYQSSGRNLFIIFKQTAASSNVPTHIRVGGTSYRLGSLTPTDWRWRSGGSFVQVNVYYAQVRLPAINWTNMQIRTSSGTIPMPSTGPDIPESLDPLPAGIAFNSTSRQLTVADTTAVGEHELRYTATVGAASKTEDFSVTVEDDDLLTLQSTSFIVHKGADRTVTLPAAAGGDSANYAYEIVEDPENPNFAARLDSSTRVLTIDDSETSVGRYTLRYTVTDGTQTATATIIINVLAAVVQLSLPTPANITLYKDEPNQSHSLPAASGGTAPYTYSLNQENGDPLPTGITFTPSTRALSLLSSQVAAGTYSLDYQVTDSSNPQGAEDADFTVTVLASRPTPLALPDIPDQTFKRSTLPQTVTLPAASGGAGSYSYLISSADEGVDVLLNGNTRVLTVRDMAPGTYAINYTAIDADDSRLVKGFIITIQEDLALPQPDNITIHVGDVGGVDLPLATGATSNVRYAVTGLPTGLSFVALGSRNRIQWIAGTTAGTHTLTYTATDGSASASRTFTLTIRAAAVVVPVEGEGPYVDPPPGVHSNLDTNPAGTEGTGSGDDDLTTGCEMGVTPSIVGNFAGISIADDKIVVGDEAACGQHTITIKCGADTPEVPGTPGTNARITLSGGRLQDGPITTFPPNTQRSSTRPDQYISARQDRWIGLAQFENQAVQCDSRTQGRAVLTRYERFQGSSTFSPAYVITSFCYPAQGGSVRELSTHRCPTTNPALRCTPGRPPTPGTPAVLAPRVSKTFRKACPVECPGTTEFELDQCELWEMANNNEEIFNIPTPETRDGSGVTTTITGLPDGLTEVDGSFGLAPTNFQAFMAFMVKNGRRVTFTMQYTTDSGETTECPISLHVPDKQCSDSVPCIPEELGDGEYLKDSGIHRIELSDLDDNDVTAENLPAGVTLEQKGAGDHPTLTVDTSVASGTSSIRACEPMIPGVPQVNAKLSTTSISNGQRIDTPSAASGTVTAWSVGSAFSNQTRRFFDNSSRCGSLVVSEWQTRLNNAQTNNPGRQILLVVHGRWSRNIDDTICEGGFVNATISNGGNLLLASVSANIYVLPTSGELSSIACPSYLPTGVTCTPGTAAVPGRDGICQSLDVTIKDSLRTCDDVTGAGPGRPPVPIQPEGTRPSHDLDIQGRDLLGVLGCGNVHIPLPVANGGSGNYTYTLYDLPTGVLYDNELHALVGSADEPLEVLITMRAFDGTGAVTDEQMTLRFVERANADNPLFTIVQYNQSNIQEIVDRTLALKIDISHMRVYKQEATVKVFFDDARLGRQIILDTTGIERGKFSILKEGTRTYIFIAPEVIRSMYNQLQTQAAGCWYIEIRSSLEPLKHRADFGSTDITERALEEEFKRLDIQDQTKIVERSAVPPEPAENSVESPHIKPDSVLTNHLNDGVVEQKAIRAGSVTEDKLRDGAVTTPKVKNLAVSANKIEQNVVDTKHIKDNAVTQAKLADPTKLLASPVQTEGKIEDAAVTTAKLKDGAVDTRNLGGGAVTTSKIKDRSVTADKIAQASLTTGNVKDGSFFRPLADREVNTENIVNKQVGRRELDYRNLYKYMQNEMAIFDLPVLNPEQIGVGQPCGFHVLPGDTKPTAFPLEGFYEYVPEEVEQDPRDISVYGGFPVGGVQPERDTSTVRVKQLKFGTTVLTDPTKGVHCLNRIRIGDIEYIGYLVQGAYLHTSSKVYQAGRTSVPAAVSGASHDTAAANFKRRLNFVLERRTNLEDPDTTTHFYMNTVIWNSALDFDTDKLTQYSTVELDALTGRENVGGLFAGVHVSVAGTDEQLSAKKLGTTWTAPASAGTPNNLPPIRTQVYSFSALSGSMSNAKSGANAWDQAILDAPKLNNTAQNYTTNASRANLTVDQATTLYNESITRLPGFGMSMVAESSRDANARRQQSQFAASPEAHLVHVCIPAQGLGYRVEKGFFGRLFGPNYTYYRNLPILKYAFGFKSNTVNKWAVSHWSVYTDSETPEENRVTPEGNPLPVDIDQRAAYNTHVHSIDDLDSNPVGLRLVGYVSDGFSVADDNVASTTAPTVVPLYERDITRSGSERTGTSIPSDLKPKSTYVFAPTADNLAPRNINARSLAWMAQVTTSLSAITRSLRKNRAFVAAGEQLEYVDRFPVNAVAGTQVHVQSVYSTSGIYRYSYTSAVGADEVTIKRGLRKYNPEGGTEDQ